MDLIIAWRNIWRNTRRTTVILVAVVMGIWSMVFLGALMRGIETGMLDNGISTLTGDLQIHESGYRSDPVIENSIADPSAVRTVLEKHLPPGARSVFRVRLNAVASNARHANAITLVGIDPVTEARASFIGDAVTQGKYLDPEDDHGILIGKALADRFETKLGRKLILMAQDTEGEIASAAFRITGIFDAEMEATEKQFAFVTIKSAQQMLKMGNRISEVSVVLPRHQASESVAKTIRAHLDGDAYEVDTWATLLPVLKAYLKMFDAFIFIWYVVVFIAMGFGLTNTTLMAVFERMREFGLLKALGMKPIRIIRQVLMESSFLLLIGMALGNLLGIASTLLLSRNGIDLSSLAAGAEYAGMTRVIIPVLKGGDVMLSNLVVLVLGLLVSLYPALKAARFTPVEAMAHV